MPTNRLITTSGNIDWSSGANWSATTAPATGEDIIIENSSANFTSGLAQSAVTLASLTIKQTFTGTIGILGTPLAIGVDGICRIGDHDGPGSPAGSGRININFGTVDATEVIIVNSAAQGTDTNLPPIRLIMTHANDKVYVRKGKVGIAVSHGAETSTLALVDTSFVSNQLSDAEVFVGAGVTLAAINKTGGNVLARCPTTGAIVNRAGTLTLEGAGAHSGTIVVHGGNVISNTSGLIDDVTLKGGGFDESKSNVARTISLITIDPEGVEPIIWTPNPAVTHTSVVPTAPFKAIIQKG